MIEVSVWIDKRRRAAQGYPVKFVIREGRKRVMLSTGVYAQSDMVGGELQKSEMNYLQKNRWLADKKAELYRAHERLYGRELTEPAMKKYYDGVLKGKKDKLFLDYAQEVVDLKTKKGTKQPYITMMLKVQEFDGGVRLNDVTPAWLQQFENWGKQKGYGLNYIGQWERNIRAVFNYCLENEYTDKYPFRKFKTKHENTQKRALTLEQFRTLRDYPVETWQEPYRDMWILMVYMCGIDPVDLFSLPALEEGQTEVRFQRIKDQVDGRDAGYVCIHLEPEMLAIINKYKGKRYMLCVKERVAHYESFTRALNDAVSKVGEYAKDRPRKRIYKQEPIFKRRVTTKAARHTYASLAKQSGMDQQVISLSMGHKLDTVTDIYINYEFLGIREANRRFLDWLNGRPGDAAGTVAE